MKKRKGLVRVTQLEFTTKFLVVATTLLVVATTLSVLATTLLVVTTLGRGSHTFGCSDQLLLLATKCSAVRTKNFVATTKIFFFKMVSLY